MSDPACILIAEDDHDVREALAEALRDSGYRVACAEDGAIALSSMRIDEPCLLLLDLMMPRVDGWQVLQEMQRDARLAHVPLCVISAVADRAPPSVACKLTKPVDLPKLLETVERYCCAA